MSLYHKYDFRGEVRYYKTRLALIDPECVKYLGTDYKPEFSHWDKPEYVKVRMLPNDREAFKRHEPKQKKVKQAPIAKTLRNIKLGDVKPGVYHCCYCSVELNAGNFSRDHIIPVSRGGEDILKNLKPCCTVCNGEKGNMMLHTYIHWLNLLQGNFKVGSKDYITTQTKIINANEIAKLLSPPAQD